MQTLSDHPALTAFAVVFLIGAALFKLTTGGRRAVAATVSLDAAEDADAEDLRRGWRIRADDDVWAAYTGRPAIAAPPAPALDERTAELIVDPTLRPAEVAEVVEHVAPGVGSVVSVASTPADTTMRTSADRAALEADHAAALVADEAWELAVLFADFDRATAEARERIDRAQASVAPWSFYLHDDERAHCPHCAEAVREVSDEHKLIVSEYDTRAFDRRELDAMLATA